MLLIEASTFRGRGLGVEIDGVRLITSTLLTRLIDTNSEIDLMTSLESPEYMNKKVLIVRFEIMLWLYGDEMFPGLFRNGLQVSSHFRQMDI